MPFIKKSDYLLSYLYPVTVEIASSNWNPVLEVELSHGKFLLNSENVNYSFGSLHTLFKRIFRKLKLNWSNIENVLILGFGTGSIAEIIRKYKPGCIIEGVEIDKKVIELGKKYFNTDSLKNVIIHCAAADIFLKDCKNKYDLIVIDVYLDVNVPEELEKEQFLILVRNALRIGGVVVFNKFINSKATKDRIKPLKELYDRIFHNAELMTIMTSGKIFIARRQN